jgi:hypothetical protein
MCHRRPNKRCAAKSLVIIGAILLVIAVVIGAGGPLFSHFGMYAIFERVLDDNLVVDSTVSAIDPQIIDMISMFVITAIF